jgi:branched-chain amino acid transport system ATP-binding protein
MTLLEVQGLTKRFGSFEAVSDVEASFEEGEIYALIGPNGAGKTTFFNMISGGLQPTEGSVTFAGEDITNEKPHEIARRGLVRSFQITNILEGLTVFENVRLAVQSQNLNNFNMLSKITDHDEVEKETMEVIRRIELEDVAHDTASNLPYGQKRQLEVGLSVGLTPKMLLLDEPTAGMSHSETDAIMDFVEKLAKDYTILFVEHNMDIVMTVADHILVMAQGELVTEGSPEEIRTDEQVREIYLGGQHA